MKYFLYFSIILLLTGCVKEYNGAYPKDLSVSEKIRLAKLDTNGMYEAAEIETKDAFDDLDNEVSLINAEAKGLTKADRFKNIKKEFLKIQEK